MDDHEADVDVWKNLTYSVLENGGVSTVLYGIYIDYTFIEERMKMNRKINNIKPIIEDDEVFEIEIAPLLRGGYCIAPAAIIRSSGLTNAAKLYTTYLMGRHIPACTPIQALFPSSLGISIKEHTEAIANLIEYDFIDQDLNFNLDNVNIMYGAVCPFTLLLDSRLTLQQKLTVLYVGDYVNAVDNPNPLDCKISKHNLAIGVHVYQSDLDVLADIGYLLRISVPHTETLYHYAVNYNYREKQLNA